MYLQKKSFWIYFEWEDQIFYVNVNLIIYFQTALKQNSLGQKSVVTVYCKFSRFQIDIITYYELKTGQKLQR